MNKRIAAFALAALAIGGFAEAAHAQASPSPYTSATRYDLMGRVTGSIAPDPDGTGPLKHLATRNTYDAAGRLIKVETGELANWKSQDVLPPNWGADFAVKSIVEMTYNAQNAKLTERVNGWNGTAWETYSLSQYSYESLGRLDCTAVRMNRATYASLPASACSQPASMGSDGPDRISRIYYDAAGQVAQIRDSVGTSDDGLSIDINNKGVAEVTYGYTLNGNIEYVVDAGGHKARKCYDGLDRQTRWVFPSSTNPPSFNDLPEFAVSSAGAVNGTCTSTLSTDDYEEYGYDTNGNRTSLRKRDSSLLSYQYDFLNRNTVKIVPGSTPHTRDVYYSYDARGLVTSARFDSASGEGVIFDYDGFGRKRHETVTMDGATRTLESQYDRDGNRVKLIYPDTANQLNYTYDGLDRLRFVKINNSYLFREDYDSAGRLYAIYRLNTSTADWGPATGFAYDPASRLRSIELSFVSSNYNTTTTFIRNPANQISSLTRTRDSFAYSDYANINQAYQADGLNQYDSVAGVAFVHDANGNLTSDGPNTYVYDVENRLVAHTAGSNTSTLRYDPLGRLYELVTIYGGLRWLHDGDALVAEYGSSDGALAVRWIHGTSAGDDPLVQFSGSGVADANRYYLFADEKGSIVARTTSAGTVTTVGAYDEYGIPNAGFSLRFGYTGQVWIAPIGMYYYKARMYSSRLGRFIQTDPIGYDDQFNLYSYVANDPINGVDVTGLEKIYAQKSGSLNGIRVSVEVNSAGLTQSQLNNIGADFAGFINANDGANISGFGKEVTGDATETQKNVTHVVSQFVGVAFSALGRDQAGTWAGIKGIVAGADKGAFFGGRGPAAQYNPDDQTIEITGSRLSIWGGASPYSSASNLGRLILHEGFHPFAYQQGWNDNHQRVDREARNTLKRYGLDGGGCVSLSYGMPIGGFYQCQ